MLALSQDLFFFTLYYLLYPLHFPESWLDFEIFLTTSFGPGFDLIRDTFGIFRMCLE